MTSTNELYHAL